MKSPYQNQSDMALPCFEKEEEKKHPPKYMIRRNIDMFEDNVSTEVLDKLEELDALDEPIQINGMSQAE